MNRTGSLLALGAAFSAVLTTASGKPLRVSDNAFMFREVEVKTVRDE